MPKVSLPEPYWTDGKRTIYCADCREILPLLRDVTAVVTDPPYGLSFMGKDWDRGVPGQHFWELIAAACLPGAPMLAFGGTRTYHRLVCAIEDAGWEIRDCLQWLYGSGFPKSMDVGKQLDKEAGVERERLGRKASARDCPRSEGWERPHPLDPDSDNKYETTPATDAAKLWDGWGTALKPAHEPICLAMNPLDGTFAQNAQAHGVAGLNVDGGRVGMLEDDQKSEGGPNQSKTRTPSGMWGTGTHNRDGLGRWPANVLHDGSEEVLAGFPERLAGGSRKNTQCGKLFIHGGAHESFGDSGSAARFFYAAKASKSERGEGNNHPTVKPLALIKYLVTLVMMPERNLILDPFMGSGTTLRVAKDMDLECIGIELKEEYCEIAAKRLQAPPRPMGFFRGNSKGHKRAKGFFA